jgi:hypothetical protein
MVEVSLPFGLIFLLLSSAAWAQDQEIAVDISADDHITADAANIAIAQTATGTECQYNGLPVCTQDAGDCQLRVALLCANAWSEESQAETTKITFADLQREQAIELSMVLPVITADGLEIDGFTCVNCTQQAGQSVWTPNSAGMGELSGLTAQALFAAGGFQVGPTIDGSYHANSGPGASVGSTSSKCEPMMWLSAACICVIRRRGDYRLQSA